MACCPKRQPETIDLCESESESDSSCDCVCTCEREVSEREVDSKSGVCAEADGDCVDVTSDFGAPYVALTLMDTTNEASALAGLPDILLHDEVHHFVRAVQQSGSNLSTQAWTSATALSSTFDAIYSLMRRWEESLMVFVATPTGAAKATVRLRLRLERLLVESIERNQRATDEKRSCNEKKRALELAASTVVHSNHLELIQAADGCLDTMPDYLFSEAMLRATRENLGLARELADAEQHQERAERAEKQAGAQEKFLTAQLQVLASAVPLAQAQQVSDVAADEQIEAELSRGIVSGVGKFCALLADLSAWKLEQDAAGMAALHSLARELVRFWTLSRSVLPDDARGAAASSFSETMRTFNLAAPIRQALERICSELGASAETDEADGHVEVGQRH